MASMKNCIRPYIEAGKKCRKTYHREKYKLTVHVVKSVFKTRRGLSVTPSSAVGP